MKTFTKIFFISSACLLVQKLSYAQGAVYNFNFYNEKKSETTNTNKESDIVKNDESEKENNTSASKAKPKLNNLKEKKNGLDLSLKSYQLTQGQSNGEIERRMTGIGVGYKHQIFNRTFITPQLLLLRSEEANRDDTNARFGHIDYGMSKKEITPNYRISLTRKFSVSNSSSFMLGLSAHKLTYKISDQYSEYLVADQVFKVVGAEVLVGYSLEFRNVDLYAEVGVGRGKVKGSQNIGEGFNNAYISSIQGSIGVSLYL